LEGLIPPVKDFVSDRIAVRFPDRKLIKEKAGLPE